MVGIRWKTGSPSASTSSSFNGSVVQYRYQTCWPSIVSPSWPRMTVGSAQLSTVPSPGTTGASGFS